MSHEPNTISFNDGAAYERYMGVWSRLAGREFLAWLSPSRGLRWLDVGCGNGAFTSLIAEQCAPASLTGVDPAPAQLAFARTREWPCPADFREGDAMGLPFDPHSFDIAVMPLVLFFVPDPAKGVAEMARVVRPGGSVCAYSWDLTGGGFPYHLAQETLRTLGITVPQPPSKDAVSLEHLPRLWHAAGLADIRTHEIVVARTFTNFDDHWTTLQGGPSLQRPLAGLTPEVHATYQERLREQLPTDAHGQITYTARAHAVCGRVTR
mgnify:CR=1 FL=1